MLWLSALLYSFVKKLPGSVLYLMHNMLYAEGSHVTAMTLLHVLLHVPIEPDST